MFGEISEENNIINTIYIKQYNYNCFDDSKNEYVAYRYIYGSMQNLFMTLKIAYNLGFAPKCFNEKMTFDYIKNVLLEPLNNDIYDVLLLYTVTRHSRAHYVGNRPRKYFAPITPIRNLGILRIS
jgi:hypothetical protein